MDITAVILTKNEEKNILDCLESLGKFFGEIIMIDDNSDDRTIEITKKYSKIIKTYKRNLNNDFASQRNFGLSKSSNEWVLFLDADERLNTPLINEIEQAVNNDKFNGYYISRKDNLWGKELNYGEVGAIKLLRLAKKSKGKWRGKVHEIWDIKGDVGKLNFEIKHYPHQTIREFLAEINYYSSIRSKEIYEYGVRANLLDIIIYPSGKFLLNYFVKLGFLDGVQGVIIAVIMSFHSFLVRGKLWLLQNKK